MRFYADQRVTQSRKDAEKFLSKNLCASAPLRHRGLALLSRDGTVVMPLEKTFWAARFGMLVDRFGIPWLINCEGSE